MTPLGLAVLVALPAVTLPGLLRLLGRRIGRMAA